MTGDLRLSRLSAEIGGVPSEVEQIGRKRADADFFSSGPLREVVKKHLLVARFYTQPPSKKFYPVIQSLRRKKPYKLQTKMLWEDAKKNRPLKSHFFAASLSGRTTKRRGGG